MRVLLLVPEIDFGGVGRLIFSIAPRLVDRGHDVSVASWRGQDDLAPELDRRGVGRVRLGATPKRPFAFLDELRTVCLGEHPDVLHTFLLDSDTFGGLAGFLAGVPRRFASITSTTHIRSSIRLAIRYRILGRLFSRVLSVSDAVSRDLEALCGLTAPRVVKLENGAEERPAATPAALAAFRARLDLDATRPTFGILSRLDPRKGHRHLIDAWPHVLKRVPDARLVIGGTGECDGALRARASELGLGDAVRFAGRIPDEETPAFFSALDGFVLPSIDEAHPIVLIEAMLAGIPVVASRTGGIPEVVTHGETGLLVPPGDPENLALALVSTLRNPDATRRRAEAGLRFARAHTADAMVDRLVDLYREA